MTTQISGDTGVSQVQPGSIGADDFQAALFQALLTQNGYQKLPSGLIIQWGRVSVAGTLDVTFPIPFPNEFFSATSTGSQATGFAYLTAFVSLTNAGGQLNCIKPDGSAVTAICSWIAIGY